MSSPTGAVGRTALSGSGERTRAPATSTSSGETTSPRASNSRSESTRARAVRKPSEPRPRSTPLARATGSAPGRAEIRRTTGTTPGREKPPTSTSAPATTYRCPPGERRMKYATAICHTVHSSAGRRTGSQPQGATPLAPPAERTRAALRALVVQRRPRPQVTQRPSAPSSCCLSNARQAAASRHASAPAREGFPEAPEGSRPRSGTVDPRTPRRYFCTPSARSPNSTASTPHYPLRRTFVRLRGQLYPAGTTIPAAIGEIAAGFTRTSGASVRASPSGRCR